MYSELGYGFLENVYQYNNKLKRLKLMKRYARCLLLFSATFLISCSLNPGAEKANLLPVFGEIEKSDEQLKIDKDFIAECDKHFNL